ncbi:MAG: mannose-1-phosphate guanylyltransferase [Alphaproteobacteria bacterium]
MDKADIVPVILAGGMGRRLRPLTGEKAPKPFLRLFSDQSLFQGAVLRGAAYGDGAPIIVCHEAYISFVQEQLAEINVTPRQIIVEPAHKGTATAIALAAFSLKNQGKSMLVMPSDHVLGGGQDALSFSVEKAMSHVAENFILMGAKPTRPETGYGYIVYDTQGCDDDKNVMRVKKFVEKPDRAGARTLLKSEAAFWNTGIFLVRPRIYLRSLEKFEAELYKQCERSFYAHKEEGQLCYPAKEEFFKILPISVDYAVMEHCDNAFVCSLSVDWSDVGTWPRLIQTKISYAIKKRANGQYPSSNSQRKVS